MRRALLVMLLALLSFTSGKADPGAGWTQLRLRYPDFAAQLDTLDKTALEGLYESFCFYEQLAALSANCYPNDPAADIPDGWELLGADTPEGEIVLRYNTSPQAASSGFHAKLYRRTSRRHPCFVLAFAGTDEMTDVLGADLFGALRSDEAQTRLAVALVGELTADPSRWPLWLTGHSLGGRLALEAGVTYMQPAIVFNPASLSRDTKRAMAAMEELSGIQRIGALFRNQVTLAQFTAVYAVSDADRPVSVDTGKLVSSLGEGLSDMWNKGEILGGLGKIGSAAVESLEGDLLNALQRNEFVSDYIGEEIPFGRIVRLRHAGSHKIAPLYQALKEHREMIALRLQMM